MDFLQSLYGWGAILQKWHGVEYAKHLTNFLRSSFWLGCHFAKVIKGRIHKTPYKFLKIILLVRVSYCISNKGLKSQNFLQISFDHNLAKGAILQKRSGPVFTKYLTNFLQSLSGWGCNIAKGIFSWIHKTNKCLTIIIWGRVRCYKSDKDWIHQTFYEFLIIIILARMPYCESDKGLNLPNFLWISFDHYLG